MSLFRSILPPLAISLFSTTVLADPPFVFRAADGKCAPSAEICGDGIDEDCDGTDLGCAGGDADRDGFAGTADCDDSDRKIYPGIYAACDVSGTPGTKLCQTNGTFSGCTTTPLCEAVSGGKCYYISALSGSDSNSGSFVSPWKTFRKVTYYNRESDFPAGKVTLKPGDVIYFMSGVYSDTYAYDTGVSPFSIRSFIGTETAPLKIKAYPGTNPVLSPNQRTVGLYLFNSKNIIIEGLEIAKANLSGIRIEDCAGPIELRNVWVHDTDGEDNSNMAGIYAVRSSNLKIHHSFVHDNYDHICADTAGNKTPNSRNMVFFEGGNIRVNHNVIFQTPAISAQRTGTCVAYKHGQTLVGGIFEVDHNTFKNCWGTTVGNSGYGGRFHHNLVVDSDGMTFGNFGRIGTVLGDNKMEFNTFVNSSPLDYRPSQALAAGVPFGTLVFRRNIVVRNGPYSPDSPGLIWIDPYGEDSTFAGVKGNLTIDENCYFTPDVETKFGLFSNSSNATQLLGALYTFSQWKGQGFDLNSTVGNPQLEGRSLPALSGCSNKGIYAQ